MAFSMPCTHPNCHKMQEPYIDPKTDRVFCSLCDQEITVTHFVRVQLKTLKQYKPKTQTSFSVKCPKCNKEGRPKIINDEVVCGSCSKPLDHLSLPFKIMLKQRLKSADKDI